MFTVKPFLTCRFLTQAPVSPPPSQGAQPKGAQQPMTTAQGRHSRGPGQDKNPTGGAKTGLAEKSRSSEILLVPRSTQTLSWDHPATLGPPQAAELAAVAPEGVYVMQGIGCEWAGP